MKIEPIFSYVNTRTAPLAVDRLRSRGAQGGHPKSGVRQRPRASAPSPIAREAAGSGRNTPGHRQGRTRTGRGLPTAPPDTGVSQAGRMALLLQMAAEPRCGPSSVFARLFLPMRWLLLSTSLSVLSCGAGSPAAAKNRTFYDWAVATSGGEGAQAFEQRYPRLDLSGSERIPEYLGYTVLLGGVHLSRPKTWMLRDGNNSPGQAFVRYVSPSAYSFALYERPESPSELWRDVMKRFEDDTRAAGAKILGKRIPTSSALGQGRAYTIERSVQAPKRPLMSRSREVLLRGEHRIILAQIVYEGDDLDSVDAELLRVMATLEIL